MSARHKISNLSASQMARMPDYVREWTAIGLSTDSADRPRAEAAIVAMYRHGGLSAPRIVWTTSPLASGLTRDSVRDSVWASVRASVRDSVWASVRDSVGASVWASVGASVWASVGASVRDSVGASVWASVGASVRDSVGASVRDSVRDSVWDSVGASVRDSVGASVGASVWASVGASVWASVWDSVWASVGDSVRESVGASVGASVGDSVGDSVYGQHDAGWLAFYKFFRDECGLVEQTAKLSGLWELCQSAGWVLPHKNICWVSERQNILHRDAAGRLHCETGPACAYPDRFGVWAWHGVRVPKEWIEDRASLRPETVLAATSVEQRAAGANIVGWPKMATALKRRVIDGDPDSDMGALVELTLPGLPEPGRFLMARCPRNGTICEGVPHVSDIDNLPIETALAAQAWRIGDPQSEYQHPAKRT